MASSLVYCAACGAAHRPQAKFCVVCGQALQGALQPLHTGGSVSNARAGSLVTDHLLKQRYRILSQLGQGGMGAVYKVEDMQLGNRLMAVKEMSQSGLNPQELIEAIDGFRQEALLLAGLMHPNLPRIYDHFTEGGHWYLVMDFIEGETLEDHLKKAGRLPVGEVLEIGIQLCTVLDYLHTRQPPIIFRDLKPANVMLADGGHLYLIDFGIARHFKPGKAKDTLILGSPGYAAPEQYGKAQTTPSADIYSLGATLHQLLSGDDPSGDPFQLAPLQLGGQPGVSRLETLIMQMVEMSKDKRPTSIVVVKQELQLIYAQRMTGRSDITRPARVSPPLSGRASSPGAFQKTKEQWLAEGKAHLDAKHYKRALAAYDHTIQLDPNNAQAYYGKGAALYDLRRYQEALAAYEQAIQFAPNNALAYHGKGNVLRDLKRYQEAIAAYDRAIQLDPGDADAYNGKGIALRSLQRYQEALAAHDRAIQLAPNNALAYTGKGATLRNLQRYQEALGAFDHAIQLAPDFAIAYNGKGVTLRHLKLYNEALAAFDHAIQLAPNFAAAYHNKGTILEHFGRTQQAQQAYERARQLGYSGQ